MYKQADANENTMVFNGKCYRLLSWYDGGVLLDTNNKPQLRGKKKIAERIYDPSTFGDDFFDELYRLEDDSFISIGCGGPYTIYSTFNKEGEPVEGRAIISIGAFDNFIEFMRSEDVDIIRFAKSTPKWMRMAVV